MIKLKIIMVTFFLILLAWAITAQQEMIKQCEVGSLCVLDDFVQISSDVWLVNQSCNMTIFLPSGILAVNGDVMNNNSYGRQWYNYTPTIAGYHAAYMRCNSSGNIGFESMSFVVINNSYSRLLTQINNSILTRATSQDINNSLTYNVTIGSGSGATQAQVQTIVSEGCINATYMNLTHGTGDYNGTGGGGTPPVG